MCVPRRYTSYHGAWFTFRAALTVHGLVVALSAYSYVRVAVVYTIMYLVEATTKMQKQALSNL